MKRLWVIGSGGHARVVIDTALTVGDIEIAGVLDDDQERIGQHVFGIEIVRPITRESIASFDIEYAVIAIGSNRARATVAELVSGAVSWTTLVHPCAYVVGHTRIGDGTVLVAGAILQPASTLGDHVILNTHASVDHDSVTGDYAHIAPGAHLAGDVRLGSGAFIGLEAGVIPGLEVGEWTTVGAGSMVIRDVAPHATVVGVPAYPRGK